jgi:3-oxoacyl-[acyl-carrier protein] reductase
MSLLGKVCLITGASKGIGEAVARHLVSNGAKVLLTSRGIGPLKDLSEDLNASQRSEVSAYCPCDASSVIEQAKAFALAKEKFGGVDYVFANAGFDGKVEKSLDDWTVDDWKEVFDLNFFGVVASFSLALPFFRERKGGCFVATSSITATVGRKGPFEPQLIPYCCTKSALEAMIRLTSVYQNENIRLYSIAPAAYRTALLEAVAQKYGTTADELSQSVNPCFPYAGDPKHLGKVVQSLFDGSTLYEPGSLIVCEDNITYNAHEHYKRIETGVSWVPGKPEWELLDYRGAKILK